MDKSLFEEALKMNDAIMNNEGLYSFTVDFFKDYSIPNEAVDFFKEYSFNSNIRFKNVYFDRVNDMPENNLYEENKKCISNGLLIIGSGLNGDFIVLELGTLKVGYVFHVEIWENESSNIYDSFISLNCTIGEFYYKSFTNDDFPVDGYQAEEYMQK